MVVNRWIGKAVPVSEVKMFCPGNIKPGDFFQITDGNEKYGFRYPVVVPEQDLMTLIAAIALSTACLNSSTRIRHSSAVETRSG